MSRCRAPTSPKRLRRSAAAVVATLADARQARILVVDDEDMIGMILRRALKPHDVTVLTSAKRR